MAERTEARQPDVDRLYGLALGEFTSARDELSRELRSAGDREGAAEVKRLRKPTAAAWALNQVRRNDRTRADELLRAGERLREAQQRLLAGEGREPFQEATKDERRLVDQLVEQAKRELAAHDQSPSAATTEKLRATLHAVASDPDARHEFAAGRLVRDYEPTGLGPVPEAGVPTRPGRPRKSKQAPSRSDASRERTIRQLEGWLENAGKRQRAAEETRGEAEDRLRQARMEAARAASELERAEAAEEEARRRTAEAAEEVAALQRALREAADADGE